MVTHSRMLRTQSDHALIMAIWSTTWSAIMRWIWYSTQHDRDHRLIMISNNNLIIELGLIMIMSLIWSVIMTRSRWTQQNHDHKTAKIIDDYFEFMIIHEMILMISQWSAIMRWSLWWSRSWVAWSHYSTAVIMATQEKVAALWAAHGRGGIRGSAGKSLCPWEPVSVAGRRRMSGYPDCPCWRKWRHAS